MKKILSLVLVLSLVLGSFSMAFAAAPADVDGTKYQDAVTRLAALEILGGYEDGTFKPEKTITRAEFAKIMANAKGVGEAAKYANGQTKFVDVPADHWAAGYINVVSDMGIITGYGDGNFGPNDQVKYQDAITMIVRALGYKPKAENMGGYPGGYLAVAAEEEITDDVNVVAVLAATRGDVALMVDNSLTVDVMEQEGYGTLISYKVQEGKNLLKALDVKEYEGQVVEIPRTDSSLDDNEIVLDVDGELKTLEMKTDVDYMTLLGVEIKVWADDSDVFFVDVTSKTEDIMFDSLKDADKDGIKLIVKNKTYKWADETSVFVNFEEVDSDDLKDIKDNVYGYVVLDKKDKVIAANLFNFDLTNKLVTKFEKEEISLKGTGDIDLDDYEDGVYVYDKNFKTIDKDDIDVNSVIYKYADDEEVFLVVVNETVEGKLTSAKSDSVKIDGDKIDASATAYYSTDNNDSISDYTKAEDLTDLVSENVVVIKDINGDLKLITSDVKTTSDVVFGLFKDSGRNGFDYEMRVYTQDGEKVDYKFEDKADYNTIGATNENTLVAFKLNKDSEIVKGSFKIGTTAIAAKYSSDFTNETHNQFDVNKSNKYLSYKVAGNTIKLYSESNTIFFNVASDDKATVVKFEDFEDVNDVRTKAVLREDKGNDLAVVVLDNVADTAGDAMYGVVTEEPSIGGDDSDWMVTIHVAGEGKVTYVIDGSISDTNAERAKFAEGKVVEFNINANDEITSVTNAPNSHTVTDIDGSYLQLNGAWRKVESDAIIYLLEEDGDIDKELDYADIDENDTVVYNLNDESKISSLVVLTGAAPVTPGTESGLITNKTPAVGGAYSIIIDGNTTYVVNSATVLRDGNNTIIRIGGTDVKPAGYKGDFADLLAGDNIEVTAVANVATEIKRSSTLLERTAETALETAKATANNKVEADYTPATWAPLQAALALADGNYTDNQTKTNAINVALGNLAPSTNAQLADTTTKVEAAEAKVADMNDALAADLTIGSKVVALKEAIDATTAAKALAVTAQGVATNTDLDNRITAIGNAITAATTTHDDNVLANADVARVNAATIADENVPAATTPATVVGNVKTKVAAVTGLTGTVGTVEWTSAPATLAAGTTYSNAAFTAEITNGTVTSTVTVTIDVVVAP